MAQADTQQFGNRRLLAVAVGLGLLFVGLYMLQEALEARRISEGQTLIVRLRTDLEPEQALTAQNVEAVAMDAGLARNIPSLVRWDEIEDTLGSQRVQRRVLKNELLLWSHLGKGELAGQLKSEEVESGWRQITLNVETEDAGALVSPGDRVDVLGALSLDGTPPRMQLIIEGVKVLAVGSVTDPDERRRDFRTLSVMVPRDVVPDLMEVVHRRVVGRVKVALRNPADYQLLYPYDTRSPQRGGRIADPVRTALTQPAPALGAPRFDDDDLGGLP